MSQHNHKGHIYSLFFVLNGLTDGYEGEFAQKSGTGEQLKDGWYYLYGDDVDGDGPYDFREEAQRYAISQIENARSEQALAHLEGAVHEALNCECSPDEIDDVIRKVVNAHLLKGR